MSALTTSPPRHAHRPRRLVAGALARLPAVLWRLRHPAAREAWTLPGAPALERLTYRTEDGWVGEVHAVPARAEAAAEPVVLLASLGLDPKSFLGPLVDGLLEAGFAPYLVGHRGGGGAVPVEADAGPLDFDAIGAQDLPAALAVVRAHAGYPRVHLVGHGFGGQVALAHVGGAGGLGLASLALLSTPVRFSGEGAAERLLTRLQRLPGRWSLPVQQPARWASAWVHEGGVLRRTLLAHRGVDVPRALVVQVAAWMRAGALVDRAGGRDLVASLSGVHAPLWLALAPGDRLCPERAALAMRDAWTGGPVTVHRPGIALDHVDWLTHPEAVSHVHAPLVAWLDRQRWRAWRGDSVQDVGAR